MPSDIKFPDVEPQYVFERDCLRFPAVADGKPFACLITAELLYSNFGAEDFTEGSMRTAYREHRDEIHAIAQSHIENGWFDNERRLFLTTRFTRLTVTFGEWPDEWPQGRALANEAHRLLLELIGPNAGPLEIEWGYVRDDEQGRRLVTLRIVDPIIQSMVSVGLEPKDRDPSTLGMRLARTWGALLQLRSQNLIQKFG